MRIVLTAGQAHDLSAAPDLIEGLKPGEHVVADRGYDACAARSDPPDRRQAHIPPSTAGSSIALSTGASIASAILSSASSASSSTSGASQPASTSSPATSSLPSSSPPLASGPALMSPLPRNREFASAQALAGSAWLPRRATRSSCAMAHAGTVARHANHQLRLSSDARSDLWPLSCNGADRPSRLFHAPAAAEPQIDHSYAGKRDHCRRSLVGVDAPVTEPKRCMDRESPPGSETGRLHGAAIWKALSSSRWFLAWGPSGDLPSGSVRSGAMLGWLVPLAGRGGSQQN